MGVIKYRITKKYFDTEDTFIIQVIPEDGTILSYKPGMYCEISNPTFRPDKPHTFSIASSPETKEYLEFCVKIYGDWTKTLAQKKVNDTLIIDGPFGDFVWDERVNFPVFLVGGAGISPVMSMIRTIAKTQPDKQVLLMYGNRTPETIAYKSELVDLKKLVKHLQIVDIFSHLPDDYPWKGHRGFITKDILQKEVDFTKTPTFFIVGPPIFIDKMIATLTDDFQVKNEAIHFEKIG